MRKALVVILLLIIVFGTGIIARNYAGTKYIDLRAPVYLVIDETFWSGCESDPKTEDECHNARIEQINAGATDWFRHFSKATRPKIVIVYSEDDLPDNPVNTPIPLKMDQAEVDLIKTGKGFCGMATPTIVAAACYTWGKSTIVFEEADDITSSIFAHELGHAMGRSHTDTADDVYSIMSYTREAKSVLPVDIKILCEMHPECPAHEDTWCEGGFWDPDRCPSSSYEEGEVIYKVNHPANPPQ